MIDVMIVDDEMIERIYLSKIFKLHSSEFTVIGEASNGLDAVKLFQKLRPHVVIMDIEMPELNGIDASILIKKIEPTTIIILNTAFAEFEFAKRAVDNHLDGYILKPSSNELILSTIQKCINPDQTPSNNPTQTTDTIKEYLCQHYSEKITLETLTNIVHFNPSYLSHIFHQEQGVTIRSFLNDKRMEAAKNLLLDTSLNINEISKRSGFTNTTHFNRLFKKIEGISPQDFRKSKRRVTYANTIIK